MQNEGLQDSISLLQNSENLTLALNDRMDATSITCSSIRQDWRLCIVKEPEYDVDTFQQASQASGVFPYLSNENITLSCQWDTQGLTGVDPETNVICAASTCDLDKEYFKHVAIKWQLTSWKIG
jgi:hypothetical protein